MKFSEEQIEFLKNFKGEKTLKELATLLKEKYGVETININYFRKYLRKLNVDYKYEKYNAGCFKRGFSAWNKGVKTGVKPRRYDKNGDVIWLEKPIGSERVEKKGYTLVKIKVPNTWEYKQRVIWKEIHGEIPTNHVIIFADGNKSNFDIDNLICISKNELRQLNRYKLKKDDADLTKVGIGIVKLKHTAWKLKSKKKD
jgi:phage protein